MTNPAYKRLTKEIQMLKDQKYEEFSIKQDQCNILSLSAIIYGPKGTPWEFGKFKLKLEFTPSYPYESPNVTFVTPMFHPNIYEDGNICLDILHENWAPTYNISSILLSISSLLTDPNPDSPANPKAARLYKQDINKYNENVKQCVINSNNFL